MKTYNRLSAKCWEDRVEQGGKLRHHMGHQPGGETGSQWPINDQENIRLQRKSKLGHQERKYQSLKASSMPDEGMEAKKRRVMCSESYSKLASGLRKDSKTPNIFSSYLISCLRYAFHCSRHQNKMATVPPLTDLTFFPSALLPGYLKLCNTHFISSFVDSTKKCPPLYFSYAQLMAGKSE